jgi:hypothetical protein
MKRRFLNCFAALTHQSIGPDGIGPKILKIAAPIITNYNKITCLHSKSKHLIGITPDWTFSIFDSANPNLTF